jgi:hypothetical protein
VVIEINKLILGHSAKRSTGPALSDPKRRQAYLTALPLMQSKLAPLALWRLRWAESALHRARTLISPHQAY